MNKHESGLLHLNLRRAGCFALAFLSCIGFVFGIYFAVAADPVVVSLMRIAPDSGVSIVGLLLAALLPFLFTALAVFLSCCWMLLPLAFLKFFAYGFCLGCITAAFGTAGWIIRILILFTDTCTLPFLCYLWVRSLTGVRTAALNAVTGCTIASLCVCAIDYCLVSPCLAKLIN